MQENHEWDPGEEEFLIAVANTLAGIIHRKTMEESLYKSEHLFRTLVETMNEGMASQDENGIINFANETYCKLIGFKCHELIGLRLIDLISEADRQGFRKQISLRQKGVSDNYEVRHLTKEGKEIPVQISASPIIDETGTYRGSIGVITDISARRQGDEQIKMYTNRLEQSNRALQDFAFIASHDLQEPLRKIQTFGGRIKTKHGQALGEEGLDHLNRMLSAALRMQTLIQALLNYSRITTRPEPFAPVDLDVIVQSVLRDLEVRIDQSGGSVQVGHLPTLEADPTQMQQLFQNLIGNALKYHGDKPPLVRITSTDTSSGEVLLTVEDNGIGFEEKHAERIFAPFQRLHGRSEYEGTGMGLAICRKIIERHGGTITARSKPGEGSTFLITLPIKQPASLSQEKG
jgi:PAS domain S-box-containing protein